MSERINRINSLLLAELAQVVNQEIDFDQNVFITLTKVDTSPDLRHAKIYFSAIPNDKNEFAQKKLNNNSKRLSHLMFKKLHLKFPLTLRFIADDTPAKAFALEQFIDEVVNED